MRQWLALVAFAWLYVAWFSQEAHAGACCMSSALSGVGRLRTWEKFSLGVRSSAVWETGRWDETSRWFGKGEDYDALDLRSEIWGLVRLHRQISVFARVPWSLNFRHLADQTSWDGWFGDLQVGGRWDVLSIGQHPHIPAIAFLLGASAPTGRSVALARNPLGADVTGRGAWVLSAGVVLEKVFYPGFVQLDLGVQVPMPMERTDIGAFQRFGVSIPLVLTGGLELTKTLVLALSLRFLWEDQLTVGARRVEGSQRIDAGAGLSLSWSFDPHWTLQASVDSGLFIDALGANQPGRLTASLGLRYGFF